MPGKIEIIIGIIYGLITGIGLAVAFCVSRISRNNLQSDPEKEEISYYSTRGLEVYNKNMADSFFPAFRLEKNRDKGGRVEVSSLKEKKEQMDYFKRNII